MEAVSFEKWSLVLWSGQKVCHRYAKPKLNVFPQIAAMSSSDEELQADLSQESSIQQCQIDNEIVKNKAELHRRLLQHS